MQNLNICTEHIRYYSQTYMCIRARDGQTIMMVLYDSRNWYFTSCTYGICATTLQSPIYS